MVVARKKIREYHAKRALTKNAVRVTGHELPLNAALITPETNYESLLKAEPWLATNKLVVKPDMLFGQRGKHGLVKLNAEWEEAKEWVQEKMGSTVTVNGVDGELSHFIVEPFLAHEHEFYLGIHMERQANVISFSVAGGVEVEDNWETIKTLEVHVEADIEETDLSELLEGVDDVVMDATVMFIKDAYKLFEDLDFTTMEMNPFTFVEGTPIPLDFVGAVDDTAMFQNALKWDDLEFPNPFGSVEYPEEQRIAAMDAKTGASLKLTILNPEGRVWNIIAGGGASVIFADTVADLGMGDELGNYCEYSGGANAEETNLFVKEILGLATRNPDGRPRALLCSGGIANFTDIAKTTSGIVHALRDFEEELKAANFKIWFRRGGPNYKKGLAMMREWASKSGIETVVYGPEVSMTKIVPMAIEWVNTDTA